MNQYQSYATDLKQIISIQINSVWPTYHYMMLPENKVNKSDSPFWNVFLRIEATQIEFFGRCLMPSRVIRVKRGICFHSIHTIKSVQVWIAVNDTDTCSLEKILIQWHYSPSPP